MIYGLRHVLERRWYRRVEQLGPTVFEMITRDILGPRSDNFEKMVELPILQRIYIHIYISTKSTEYIQHNRFPSCALS